MKITKYLRFLLIALAAVMAFSLFSCTEPGEEESSSVEEPSESESTPVGGPEDSDDSSEESSEETTEKTDCQHVEEVIEAVAATCETTGLTAGKKCSVCDEILEAQTEVPALGHAWNEGVVDPAPDCDTAGVKTFTCSNDATHTKTEEVPALGHTVAVYTTYVANPDGDEAMIAGTCSVCGEMGTKPASFFASIESIFGDAGEGGLTIFQASETIAPYMSPAKFVYAAGHPSYPANGYSPIPTDSPAFPGVLGIAGWAAYLDSAVTDGAAYKIVDAEGNVISDWQPITDLGLGLHVAGGEPIDAFIAGNITEYTGVGVRFYHIIDLKPHWGVINGKTVTIEMAFTTAKGVEGDVYVPYASLSVVVPACEHVAGEPDVADNCNVKCTKCGAILEAAKHVLTDVAAAEATCEVAGNVAHKHCATCGKNYDAEGAEIADVVIPALGHKTVDKTFTAPTTTEEGWLAHTACETCGAAWDTEGNKLEAAPTIPVIVPTTNKYWGVEALSKLTVAGAGESKFKAPVISDDRSYVRFERDGASSDGFIIFMADNTEVTGQYMIIKYRTDHSTGGELWANTTENSHSGGKANFSASLNPDDKWHILVYDLSINISGYVKTNENGEYIIQWARFDILNSAADAGYVDIAYIALSDDPTEFASITQEGDEALCPHAAASDPKYTAEGDKHSTECVICGEKIYEAHYATEGTTWDSEKKLYTGTCICGAEYSDEMFYRTEASPNGGGAMSSFSAEQMDGFVRYTATGSKDPYFHVLRSSNVVTGQYMVIKYRIVNNGVNCTTGAFYSGTVVTGYNGAKGGAVGDGNNMKQSNTLYADGEWHYLVVVPNLTSNTAFKPNEDGTYSWQYLRMGIGGMQAFDGSCYIDIAELAFADNITAAENYAYENDPEAAFTLNLDLVKLDDVATGDKGQVQNTSKAVDLTGKTLTTATSLELGGWCVTPGGIDAYKIRVTSIDGVAVENPELIAWATEEAGTIPAGDGVVTQGKNRGFGEDCRYGARFYEKSVDLSAWAGKTINFELVIVTNYGVEEVILQVNNVTVPAAQAE